MIFCSGCHVCFFLCLLISTRLLRLKFRIWKCRLRAEELGFRVWDLGFGVWALEGQGSKAWGLTFEVSDLGCGLQYVVEF